MAAEEENEVKPQEQSNKKSRAPKGIGTMTKTRTGPAHLKATPDNMILIAIERGRSMEEIRALIDMRNAELERVAYLKFREAKKEFLKNCPEIVKNRTADFGKTKSGAQGASYRYSDLNNLIQTVKNAEADAGLSHDWKTSYGDKGELIITAILSHEGGHSERDTMKFIPKESDIHMMGTIVSYLKRYTLQNVMGLSQGGDDDDGARAMGIEDAKVLPKPTDAKFKELVTKVAKGEITVEELDGAYSFTAEQMHSLEIAKKK